MSTTYQAGTDKMASLMQAGGASVAGRTRAAGAERLRTTLRARGTGRGASEIRTRYGSSTGHGDQKTLDTQSAVAGPPPLPGPNVANML